MGTAARMLGGKKRKKKKEKDLSRTVRREPAGSSGSAVRSPVHPVRFRLNPLRAKWPDRTGMMTGRRPVFKTLSKLHRRAAGSDTIFVLIREKTCLSQKSKFNITFISL